MWVAQHYPFETPRTFISSGGLGTMGFGLGAAIGAATATGKKTILVTGDGSFGMNLNELATAVTNQTPVVVFIMNNGVLGMVRQWQTLFFDKHYSNTTLDRLRQAGRSIRHAGLSCHEYGRTERSPAQGVCRKGTGSGRLCDRL